MYRGVTMRSFRLTWQLIVALLLRCCGASLIRDCLPSPTTVSGTFKPTVDICSGDLIFSDEFDDLDTSKWMHENTMGGGGNWEFEWYTNNRTNSYARDGRLYIKPTLVADQFGEDFLFSGTLDLNGGDPVDRCTNPAFYGCVRTGSAANALNPIKSARIGSSLSFNFKYGRLEVRAKNPRGDWLWPAIWLMPRYNAYGTWPASGEIDLMESRGNSRLQQNGKDLGVQQVATTLHFGPDWSRDGWSNAHFEQENPDGFDRDFHTYILEWKPDGMKFYYDDQFVGEVNPPTDFWSLGHFDETNLANPWATAKSRMAPFDQQFYIIINLAVGGVNGYFPDDVTNENGDKPWENNSGTASTDFWNGRGSWLPTWNGEDAAFQIDYVRVYAA